MKRRYHFIILIALLLTGCDQDGLYQITWITEGQHALTGRVAGDMVVMGGDVNLPADAHLEGSLHLISGQVTVGGEIAGNVSLLGGELTMEPGAVVAGNLNQSGGTYHPAPGSEIRGSTSTAVDITIPDLPERRENPGWATLLRTLIVGTALALLALLLQRWTPHAIERTGEAVRSHGVVCGAMGLLTGVVGISLLVTMAYTILLIPVTLLGLVAMGAAVVYGWVSMGVILGKAGAKWLKLPVRPALAGFAGTLVFYALLELISALPVLGGLIGIMAAVISLGAVVLTRFGFRRFVPASESDSTLTG